jgi:hypothetical protein
LLVPLAMLVLASVLGGVVAWVHSHGASGIHIHLRVGHSDHEDATAHARHDAAHGHEHGDAVHEPREEDEPAPGGLRIEFPDVLVASTRGSLSVGFDEVVAAAPPSFRRWQLVVSESTHRPEMFPSGWPPQWERRTGVAALLRTSRAILI